jgi:hypothetical protein
MYCHTFRGMRVGLLLGELAKCLFRVQKFRVLIPHSTHYGVGGLAGATGNRNIEELRTEVREIE